MALTATKKITIWGDLPPVLKLPAKGSTKLYGGGLAAIGADGYAIPAADTAGLKYAGLILKDVDNSAGADGDLDVELYHGGITLVDVQAGGLTQADVGATVCIYDDDQVDKDTTNDLAVGVIVAIESATQAWVRLEPLKAA